MHHEKDVTKQLTGLEVKVNALPGFSCMRVAYIDYETDDLMPGWSEHERIAAKLWGGTFSQFFHKSKKNFSWEKEIRAFCHRLPMHDGLPGEPIRGFTEPLDVGYLAEAFVLHPGASDTFIRKVQHLLLSRGLPLSSLYRSTFDDPRAREVAIPRRRRNISIPLSALIRR